MKKVPWNKMTASQLTAATARYDDPEYAPRFRKPSTAEKRRHDAAIARAARGRPKIGKGARRIQITVEQELLEDADAFASRRNLTRSQLIAKGLRLAMSA